MHSKKKIILLEGIHSLAKERLEQAGFAVHLELKSFSDNELWSLLDGAIALGIRSRTQLTRKDWKHLRHLDVVGAFCIGTNQIDLQAANKQGIPVFNAPYSNTRSVAELVISEIISLSRKICDRSNKAHQGLWDKSAKGSFEVRGKTLGIVGYGHIGSQLSVLAEAMGLHVLYYDIIRKLPLGNACDMGSLEELLTRSHFVSLHVSETDLTRGMINKHNLALMKRGAFLINASRGSVVDIDALVESLKSQHLGGAAIDVFPSEPTQKSQTFHTQLQGLDNVILTPHIGGSTEEAQKSIGLEVAESLIHYLKWGETTGALNFPNLKAPKSNKLLRIANVHRNQPGVLGSINSIISEAGVNIEGQFLSTDSEIGYLIMDVAPLNNPIALVKKISQLENSIKTRLLENVQK